MESHCGKYYYIGTCRLFRFKFKLAILPPILNGVCVCVCVCQGRAYLRLLLTNVILIQ